MGNIFERTKNYINKFFAYGIINKYDFKNIKEVRTNNIFNFVSIVILTYFIILNIYLNNYFVSFFYLSIIMLFLTNFTVFIWIKKVEYYSFFNLLIYFLLFLFVLLNQLNNVTGLLTIVIFPVIALYLKGPKTGSLFSILFLFIQLILFIAIKMLSTRYNYDFSYVNISNFIIKIFFIDLVLLIATIVFEINHSNLVKEIDKSNEKRTNFFIDLAHETKTPLTLISNYLNEYTRTQPYSNELNIVKRNIDKLLKEMVNYLDIEKMERGYFFYDHSQIINLSKILKEKLLMINELAAKKNIKIIQNINYYQDIFMKIDIYAIDRIINNILSNAIKYTNENSEIKISLRINEDNLIELKIADSGIGISEEKIKNIFKPYYEFSKKKKSKQRSGLGLSIVKKIIDQVNGEIKIESKKNIGTTFILLFENLKRINNNIVVDDFKLSKPFIDINNEKINEDKYEDGKYNILIIEDNYELLSYFNMRLKSIYNISCAKNGLEALENLKNKPKPDIIISDILMDKMNGYEFLKRVQEDQNFKDIPFIFITTKNSFNEKIEGLTRGAIDYLYKPFYISELLVKINSIIKMREFSKEFNINAIQSKILNALRKNENTIYENDFNNKCDTHGITIREKIIIKYLISGLEYKEISSKLDCPVNTIKKRIHLIYKKLRIHNKVELIKKMK